MPDKMKWVKEWQCKAENDLITAEIVLSYPGAPTDTICFHAQQCAEKYLKSYLTFKDITVEKTHDLAKINNACISVDPEFEELSDAAEILSVMPSRSGILALFMNIRSKKQVKPLKERKCSRVLY